ncbi:TonB-dependent receptor [Dyella sp.]|uniref:TonB-dependent receptor plug domain-containing protein n=1 Tax=Dyella sp. TaxID=1869338 RepID=UPI003216978B
MHYSRKTLLCTAIALAMAGFAATAAAQDASNGSTAQNPAAPSADQKKATNLEGVTVLGSRRIGGSETETPVPVDVIPMQKLAEQSPQFDLAQNLQYTVPSFTSVRQTGSDNADLVDSAALRGLGSDQTLVLENGKRRHSVALVNLFGARNRGNTGTDLNAIPALAIERVEVLRDGAAAQYGSDAIAGVMNIVLKKSPGCESVAGFGEYTRGDGKNYLTSAYCGFRFDNGGSVGITGEWQKRGRSNRSDPGDPRTIGDTKVDNETLYVNGEVPVAESAHLYFTGGVQNRSASSAAFARGGIGSDDIPSRNSAAMYPDGFVPYINGAIKDRYAILGVWDNFGDWRADLSQTYGYNALQDIISNTLNASIANADLLAGGPGLSPNRFHAGGFSFEQETTNLDLSRYYGDILAGLNIAFGAEYRRENYRITPGERGSYIDADGPGGGNAGSQGFPGFQPGDATNQSRHSYAAYADVETDWTERFLTDAAVRYEHYSDFGSTTTGKLAGAFHATDKLLLRGSVSTGFRAPSLQQRWFSSTFTDFVSGQPVDVVLAPNGGTIANAAGIPPLKEEKSKSYTLGATWSPGNDLQFTLDGYRIDIDDRIVLSGRFDTTDPNIGGILQQLGVGQAQFFVNSVDTSTKGLDFTASHRMDLGGGTLRTNFGFNRSFTRVKKIHAPPALAGREDVLLSDRERLFLEDGAPSSKAILGFDYALGQWEASWKFIYFGPMTLGTFSGPPVPNQHYADKTSADVALTYHFNDQVKLTVGGSNIFDKFPSKQDPNETDNGFKYEAVQFGLNGASWFARVAINFK